MKITHDDEITKYRKKSIKHCPQKSNHKHDYSETILIRTQLGYGLGYSYHPAKRCSICGKIGKESWFETAKTKDGYARMLTSEEILEKYKWCQIIDR